MLSAQRDHRIVGRPADPVPVAHESPVAPDDSQALEAPDDLATTVGDPHAGASHPLLTVGRRYRL
jgi:hypothetical protein